MKRLALLALLTLATSCATVGRDFSFDNAKRIQLGMTEAQVTQIMGEPTNKIYLPYCIEKQADKSWLIMNREYSPVGFNAEHVQPGGHPVTVKLKGLTPGVLRKLAFNGEMEDGRIYLYNDACNPVRGDKHMQAYLQRIALLARLKVV